MKIIPFSIKYYILKSLCEGPSEGRAELYSKSSELQVESIGHIIPEDIFHSELVSLNRDQLIKLNAAKAGDLNEFYSTNLGRKVFNDSLDLLNREFHHSSKMMDGKD